MLHDDWSGFNEQMGVNPTYIYAGEHKIEPYLRRGRHFESMTEYDEAIHMFEDIIARHAS